MYVYFVPYWRKTSYLLSFKKLIGCVLLGFNSCFRIFWHLSTILFYLAVLKVSVSESKGNTVDMTVRLYGPNTEYVINRERELQVSLLGWLKYTPLRNCWYDMVMNSLPLIFFFPFSNCVILWNKLHAIFKEVDETSHKNMDILIFWNFNITPRPTTPSLLQKDKKNKKQKKKKKWKWRFGLICKPLNDPEFTHFVPRFAQFLLSCT